MLLLAFTPDDMVLRETPTGRELRDMRDLFVCRQAADKFAGYLRSQRARLVGEKSQRTNRPELVEQFGFDPKYAAHMVRLGWQGVELMRTGSITLPMRPQQREWLLALRRGEHSLAEALAEADESLRALEVLRELSTLPSAPDWRGINTWLKHTYMREWTRNQLV